MFGGSEDPSSDIDLPEELSHLDPKLVELIMNEVRVDPLAEWNPIGTYMCMIRLFM